jgi:hypothetical protein
VLYCTVQYCTVQCCTVLCYTVLYSTVLYSAVLYCIVLYRRSFVDDRLFLSHIVCHHFVHIIVFLLTLYFFLPSSFLLPLLFPTLPFLSFLPTLTHNTPPPSPSPHRARRCALSSSALSCPLELPRSKSWYVRSNRSILHGTVLHCTVLYLPSPGEGM